MAGPNAPDPRMDANDLYREDTFTDRKVGTIRVMTPVKSDGSTDPARASLYVGQAQIMTPAGVLPLSFEIPAANLAEACAAAGDVSMSNTFLAPSGFGASAKIATSRIRSGSSRSKA